MGASLGKTGLTLSLLPWLGTLLVFALRPGWGSPVPVLAGLATLLATPASIIVSTVGLFRDDVKTRALAGLVIGAAAGVYFFVIPWVHSSSGL